jgi:hypothetical protein
VFDAVAKFEGNYASVGHVLPVIVMEHRKAGRSMERLIDAGYDGEFGEGGGSARSWSCVCAR